MRIIIENKITFRFLLLLMIALGCQSFIACQTKDSGVAAALQQCRQLLDKDDVISANSCYAKTMIAHPADAEEISKMSINSIFDKCSEFEDKEKYEQAIVCFEGLAVLAPDNLSPYTHLANSYYEYYNTLNDKTDPSLARAEAAARKAIELRPDSPISHESLGRILAEKGEFPESIKEHKLAVKLKPDVTYYWLSLAFSQEKSDDIKGALESYNQALAINPNYTTALYFSSLLYEKTGDLDKAIENLKKYNSLKPGIKEIEQKIESLIKRREIEKSSKDKNKPQAKSAKAN